MYHVIINIVSTFIGRVAVLSLEYLNKALSL